MTDQRAGLADRIERHMAAGHRVFVLQGAQLDWVVEAFREVERLRDMLAKIAEHPDTPLLIKQYAAGKL